MLRILAIGALLGATPAAAQTTIEAHDTRPTLAQRNGLRANFETQFAHDYVQVNGFRLHHVIGGPADGTFIVLIHGLAADLVHVA
jgi:hypothetical protein